MTPERWEQLGQLYDAAKELESAEREAFLDQACANSQSLRHEVEAMFAAEKSLGGFIAASALKDAALLLGAEPPGKLAGSQLGHYRLVSLIGAGGMGEVYQAQDTRLGRRVAVKLLAASVSGDPEYLRRFEREARTIGMLNHPNILTIYDVGEHEGMPFIVTEMLEGTALREWIKNGMIPLSRAVDFAVQMARGLAAAHERGIVHRDLKPENIFIIRDGRLKLLDFGLARLVWTPGGAPDTNEQISSAVHTNPGMIRGTVGYMAPEQLLGEEPDPRADLFAFGVVLYEMITGERPFSGGTTIETMRATLRQDPPGLPASIGEQFPSLERLMRRCLEKRPEHRFQSANDLGLAVETLIPSASESREARLRAALAEETEATPPAGPGRRGSFWRARIWWIAAGLLAFAAVLWGAGHFKPPAAKEEALLFSISLPRNLTKTGEPVISPDGRRLVFSAATEGRTRLWVRQMNSLEVQPLPGTENGFSPFWSPDSRQLGFFADGKLKKTGLSGEPPVILGDAPDNRGGTWSRDGVILFVPHPGSGLFRVSASGGTAEALMVPDGDQRGGVYLWPSFLPDGRYFLYLDTSAEGEGKGIYLASLDGRERRRLSSALSSALYAPPGYLLFAQQDRLVAQPFDAVDRRSTGEPLRLIDRIPALFLGEGSYSVSENGLLIYGSEGATYSQPVWFDRAGKRLGSGGLAANCYSAVPAPGGKRLASTRLDRQAGTYDVWVSDLTSGSDLKLTSDPADDLFPVWSPDGSRIVWASNREGPFSLYQRVVNGSGQDQLLIKSGRRIHPTDWSRDGRFILFEEADPKTKLDVWVLPSSGERQPVPWAQTPFNESSARFSPDSRWIAWTSDESGTKEVYVQAFQNPGGRWKLSAKGGDYPQWRRDGKELFYVAPDGKLMAVEVRGEPDFEPGPTRELFELPDIRIANGNYTMAPDGKSVLLVVNTKDENSMPFVALLNWTSALER